MKPLQRTMGEKNKKTRRERETKHGRGGGGKSNPSSFFFSFFVFFQNYSYKVFPWYQQVVGLQMRGRAKQKEGENNSIYSHKNIIQISVRKRGMDSHVVLRTGSTARWSVLGSACKVKCLWVSGVVQKHICAPLFLPQRPPNSAGKRRRRFSGAKNLVFCIFRTHNGVNSAQEKQRAKPLKTFI